MSDLIYLDNNATTSVAPEVLDVINQSLTEDWGNPSSIHSLGKKAKASLNRARRKIADYFSVDPDEIVFTSGGTEAINLGIRGFFTQGELGHIITSNLEHIAVLNTVEAMKQRGCEVTQLTPGRWGAPKPEDVEKAIRPDTKVIALMAVNNETGVRTDIEGIAKVAKAHNIPFLVDGVALLGKEVIKIPDGVSVMCFSGHKCHAPKGIGMAFLKHNLPITSVMTGGAHEYRHRSGTENMPGILALSKAIELISTGLEEKVERMRSLRDHLANGLMEAYPKAVINGEGPKVSNTLNISFPGQEGEVLLMHLDQAGLCVSHGSACSSGSLEPSRILLSMGIAKDVAMAALRISLSRYTTEEEIDKAIEIIRLNV